MTQSSSSYADSPINWLHYLPRLVGMVIIYVIAGMVSGRVLLTESTLPIVWFPAGITLAILMIGGYRYTPGIAIGLLIIGFARDFVDFVDVDDTCLRFLDIVIALLQQFLDDVFHIFTDIPGFGQGRRVGDGERHVE